jgi:HK97 family phage prohead protease
MPDKKTDQPTRAAQEIPVSTLVKQLRCQEREERVFPSQELRADLAKRQILGFVPYNSRSVLIWDYFTEMIEPSAFKRALDGEQDPRGYWGHSRLHVLGRYSNDTLRLKDTKKGLRYEVDAPEGDWVDSLLYSINRGDVDESSFGFTVDHSNGDRWERDKKTGAMTRYLVDVVLRDLSPVAEAAYKESKVSARSILLANEIDPEELADALEVSDRDGITDPELRKFIYDTSSVLHTILGTVQPAEHQTNQPDPPADPGERSEEPATQEEESAESTAEAQARAVASALEPYRHRLRLLEMGKE